MSESLYIYKATIGVNIYKFSIYANSSEEAQSHRDLFLKLYRDHSAKFDQSIQKLGIKKWLGRCKGVNYFRLQEVQRLQRIDLEKITFETTVLSGRDLELAQRYSKSMMSLPYCNLSVFDISKDLADELILDSTKLNDYPSNEKSKVEKMQYTNSPEGIKKLMDYYKEFFKENPRDKKGHDILKLLADQKIMTEKHLNTLSLDYLNRDYSDLIDNVKKFIESEKEHCYNTATPLMKAAARKMGDGDDLQPGLNKCESELVLQLANNAAVDEVDAHGRTALMYIVLGETLFPGKQTRPRRERFTRYLLENDADPTIEDYSGKTALDYFKEQAEADHPATLLLAEAVANWKGKSLDQQPLDLTIRLRNKSGAEQHIPENSEPSTQGPRLTR